MSYQIWITRYLNAEDMAASNCAAILVREIVCTRQVHTQETVCDGLLIADTAQVIIVLFRSYLGPTLRHRSTGTRSRGRRFRLNVFEPALCTSSAETLSEELASLALIVGREGFVLSMSKLTRIPRKTSSRGIATIDSMIDA